MSYDIGLYRKGLKNKEERHYYNYDGNITYNVYEMLAVAFGDEHLKKWNDKACDMFFNEFENGYLDMIKNPQNIKNMTAQMVGELMRQR